MGKIKHTLIPFLLVLLVAGIYLYTSAPSLLWVDAGDFIAASVRFGINNPPAPLFVFLAHFFTLLPFGSVIFRLQLFSILLASVSLFFLYRVIVSVIQKHTPQNKDNTISTISVVLAGSFGLLSLAFSYEYWSQAQNADGRFIFVCLIEMLVFYLGTIVLDRKQFFPLLLVIFFVLGLAMGIDPVIISIYPSMLLVLWQKRQGLDSKKLLLLAASGLAGIILIFSYLPIMSLRNPFLNAGRPTNLGSIIESTTGNSLNVFDPQSGHVNGFTGSLTVFFTSSWHYLQMIWLSFTPLLLPFVVVGEWYLYRKQKYLCLFFLLTLLTNFLLSGLYLSGNQEAWYLVSDSIFALFAGLGYYWVVTTLLPKLVKLPRPSHQQFVGIILLCLSFVPFGYWWTTLDRHDVRITDDYIHNVYTPIQKPAILFGAGDLFIDTSYYVHDATHYKSGVIPVIDSEFYLTKSYRENLLATTPLKIPNDSHMTFNNQEEYSDFVNNFFAMNLSRYQIFINYPALSSKFILTTDGSPSFTIDTNRFKLIPAGLVQQVVLKDSRLEPNPQDFTYQFSRDLRMQLPMLEHAYNQQFKSMVDEYAFSYNSMGDYLMQKHNLTQAGTYYQKAYAVNPQNANTLAKLGIYYASQKNYEKELEYFSKAHELDPTNLHLVYNLALANGKTGNSSEEKTLLEQVVNAAKNDPTVLEEATNALNSLGGQNSVAQNTWKVFSNQQMNISFVYPPNYDIRVIPPDQVGMFESNQNAPTITFYSAKVTNESTIDIYAQVFPYAIKGKLMQDKEVTFPGFQTAKIKAYQSGQKNTEQFFLKKDKQIFVMTIPLGNNTNNQDFAELLSKVLQSIQTIQ